MGPAGRPGGRSARRTWSGEGRRPCRRRVAACEWHRGSAPGRGCRRAGSAGRARLPRCPRNPGAPRRRRRRARGGPPATARAAPAARRPARPAAPAGVGVGRPSARRVASLEPLVEPLPLAAAQLARDVRQRRGIGTHRMACHVDRQDLLVNGRVERLLAQQADRPEPVGRLPVESVVEQVAQVAQRSSSQAQPRAVELEPIEDQRRFVGVEDLARP